MTLTCKTFAVDLQGRLICHQSKKMSKSQNCSKLSQKSLHSLKKSCHKSQTFFKEKSKGQNLQEHSIRKVKFSQ